MTGFDLSAATEALLGEDAVPWREVPVAGFESATAPPHRFAVEGIIPARHVTLLGGHGGSGKSLLALTLAAHVAAGQPWNGLAVDTGPAVFVSLEDPAGLVLYRLGRVAREYGLPPNCVAQGLRVLDGSDGDAALVRELAEFGTRSLAQTAAMEALRALVRDARLVVLDNASDAFDAGENERRSVRAFVRMLAQLARDVDGAVLLLAHVDKHAARYGGSGNTFSGSTAWHNSARSRLALLETRDGLELVHEKSNLGPRIDPLPLAWSAEGVLVSASAASNLGAASAAELLRREDAEIVLMVLRKAHADGQDVPAARVGASTAHKVLSTYRELPANLQGNRGRPRFWAALDLLIEDGRAEIEDFRRNYKDRKRIVPRPPNLLSPSPPYPLGDSAEGNPADPPNACQKDSADIRRIGGTGAATQAGMEVIEL